MMQPEAAATPDAPPVNDIKSLLMASARALDEIAVPQGGYFGGAGIEHQFSALFPWFREALDFYSAMFESLDVILERDRKERINVEQHCLERDQVNVIACEGKERVELHEMLGKWKLRFSMAGFQQYPLSSYISSVLKGLLNCYSEHYTIVEKDGAMLLRWKE